MTKKISRELLAEGAHPALDYVFEHIGVTWPIEEREALFKIALHTVFPPNARMDAWRGSDMTVLTAKNEFYYPITASLNASPKVWFNNLRLLQLRKKLNLISSLKVNQIHPSILGGEALAKLKALEEVVGAHMMSPSSVVPMQRPLLTTARMRVGGVRSDSLRNVGLAARENRDQRN